MASNRRHRDNRVSRWLIVGVIALATLIVLWLTIFEYWGATEGRELLQAASDTLIIE